MGFVRPPVLPATALLGRHARCGRGTGQQSVTVWSTAGRGRKPRSTDEPAIRAEMPQEPLPVAAYLAEPGKVEMRVGVVGVELEASLIAFHRCPVAFQILQSDSAIEMQQRIVGKML